MPVKYIEIIEGVTKKIGGKNSHESGRRRFGKNEIYHWDPEYKYPVIAARKAQATAFGEAVKKASAILKDKAQKAEYEAAWKKKDEGYATLRGYIIGKIRKGEGKNTRDTSNM